MGVRLQKLDVVVVGRFNPHIITPAWLADQGVCARADAEMLFGFDVQGRQGIFRFSVDGHQWNVTDTRLIISSSDPDEHAASKAAAVILKLPHTPISAVGHNFHYECDRQHWKGAQPQLGDIDFEKLQNHGTAQSVSWTCTIEQSGGLVCKLTFNETRDAIDVHSNLHRDVKNADEALQICKLFRTDLELSNKLVNTLAGEEAYP